VCGCWVSWMQTHVGASDQDAIVTAVVMSASVMSLTDVELVDRLSAALRACEREQ
jgi:hypothetical protein